MNPETLQDLIRRAQEGEVEAMNEFLALIRPYFEKVARGYVDPAHASRSVSDLVQEAEIQVWNHLVNFRGSPDEDETLAMFRAWVGKIIKRQALNIIRQRRTQKRGGDRRVYSLRPVSSESASGPAAGQDPEALQTTASAKFFRRECREDVREAIARLEDPVDREILVSIFFEGLSLRETARVLGQGYSRIRDRYLKLVAILERELAHLG